MYNSHEGDQEEGPPLLPNVKVGTVDWEAHDQEDGECDGEPLSLPICCHLDTQHKGMTLFRVTRAKGKAFSSGGFGVTFSTENGVDSDASEQDKTAVLEEVPAVKSTSTRESHIYLFLEEVLFLFEQGMLECQAEEAHDNETKGDQNEGSGPILSAPQLYALLETLQMPTAVYLVYAHLRQQTFRVVRYTSQRLALLRQLEICQAPSRRGLRLLLRHDIQNAPSPPVLHQPIPNTSLTCPAASEESHSPSFAFCVYPPDCNFAKSDPGLPAFLVAVTHYGQSGLDYATVQDLLRQAKGIPVKLATVSDSGTVVMFGITDYGVPPLAS